MNDASDPATNELARKLAGDEWGPLFVWPQHERTVERIWSEVGMKHLEAVLDDLAAPERGRFVAAEVLFRNEFTFVDRHNRQGIARLYAAALTRRYTGHANVWGMLWASDSAGEIGGRFLALDRDSIPVLRELLDDSTIVDWYAGSEEATVGNRQRYRIKDFAAFYLSRILRHPIAFNPAFAARDAEIAGLLAALDAK